MSENVETLKPLKTWSHLANRRRRPSEYEIVSSNLHYRTDNPEKPYEHDVSIPLNQWYIKYCSHSPLKHPDWDAFRDPDELIYRTYCILQDGQESYVNSLLEQFSRREHDKAIGLEWIQTLARLYAPARYAYHALQMGSAYISQMAPASTITNAATFQSGDALRWVTHTAYRTRELANSHPLAGFGVNERNIWENDPAWQGYRELLEKALIAYDWAEAFVAINLVAKPAIEEVLFEALGAAARANGDTLYGLISQSHMRDGERHRRWTTALVSMALDVEGNKTILEGWLKKWQPLADRAIESYCAAIPDSDGIAVDVRKRIAEYHIRNNLII